MRYYKTSKKTRFISLFKRIFSLVTVCTLFFILLNIFNTEIVNTALWITTDTKPLKEKHSDADQNHSFEEDFTVYLKNKTEEQTLSSAETQTVNNEAIAVNLSALSGKYKEYDGTSVINNTDYDVTSLLYSDYKKPKLNKAEPAVLIYHTHTSEEYYGGGTVVDVGKAMAEEFEKLGYETIHLTTVFDKEQFSGAYSRSVTGATEILDKYPSIQLVFDVHRDAITTASGDTYRPITEINDQNCAQIMFVCGTDAKGLKHPNWRENFKFALDVSRTAGDNYGALSRPVNLRGDRFNTHLTDHTFLIEVGSVANTLTEAELAAIYTARSIIKTIEK